MLYMLDTNTVSYLIHKRSPRLKAKMDSAAKASSFAVSVITEAEMLYGKALKPGSWRLAQAIQVTLAGLTVLPWSSEAAAAYATLRVENQKRGITVGTLDFLIAAHAIAADAVLLTSDGGFAKLRGALQTENWATDLTPQ
jgi:tRNA(fMet)-specific endonuclease VapC